MNALLPQAIVAKLLFPVFLEMLFDCIQRFITDYMFHFTGVVGCGFLADAQCHENFGQNKVTLIYFLSQLTAFLSKGDKAVRIHDDVGVTLKF